MISLLNGSALGFDLVRLQQGPLVADIVLSALSVRPEDLSHVHDLTVPPGRDALDLTAWNIAAPHPRSPRSDLPGGSHVFPPGGMTIRDLPFRTSQLPDESERSFAELSALLTSATLGNLDELLGCLRREVFAWTWHGPDATGANAGPVRTEGAVPPVHATPDTPIPPVVPTAPPLTRSGAAAELQDACLAAVGAAYGSTDLREPAVREAVSSWYQMHGRLPRHSVPLGPQQLQLAVLFARIQALTPTEVLSVVNTYHRDLPSKLWAPAVHEATWAAYLSGRVAAAAAAQLHLVGAVRAAGISLDNIASGLWNAVSGAVSALVVADLLDDVSCDLLLARYPVLDRPDS